MTSTPNTPTALKYGSGNLHAVMEGDDLVIRIDTKCILKPKGEEMRDPRNGPDAVKARPSNLIATSGGFTSIGPVRLSVNVTG